MKYQRKESDFGNYSGRAGAVYHEAKHGAGPIGNKMIAKNRLRKFQPFVKETDSVLEYGVGTGFNLAELCCKEKVGYDVAECCRAKVEADGIYFTSDIQEVLKWKKRFDIVICHHVLEHVANPILVLLRIRQFLKPDGRLLLCVPFDKERRFRRFTSFEPDMHLFAWNTQSICNLLLYASYEIGEAKLSPSGYERFLAPLGKLGFWCYKMGLWMARLVKPVHEIYVVARVRSTQSENPHRRSGG